MRSVAGPAFRRFKRYAQLFDFTSDDAAATWKTTTAETTQSSLNHWLKQASKQELPHNHITLQLVQQLLPHMHTQLAPNTMGLAASTMGGFGAPAAGFGASGAGFGAGFNAGSGAGFAGANGLGSMYAHKAYPWDEHNEDGARKFVWPGRPNSVTPYRHIFYNPISKKECNETNARNGLPAEHDVLHLPINVKPLDCDDHLWEQARLNKPPHPELVCHHFEENASLIFHTLLAPDTTSSSPKSRDMGTFMRARKRGGLALPK